MDVGCAGSSRGAFFSNGLLTGIFFGDTLPCMIVKVRVIAELAEATQSMIQGSL